MIWFVIRSYTSNIESARFFACIFVFNFGKSSPINFRYSLIYLLSSYIKQNVHLPCEAHSRVVKVMQAHWNFMCLNSFSFTFGYLCDSVEHIAKRIIHLNFIIIILCNKLIKVLQLYYRHRNSSNYYGKCWLIRCSLQFYYHLQLQDLFNCCFIMPFPRFLLKSFQFLWLDLLSLMDLTISSHLNPFILFIFYPRTLFLPWNCSRSLNIWAVPFLMSRSSQYWLE